MLMMEGSPTPVEKIRPADEPGAESLVEAKAAEAAKRVVEFYREKFAGRDERIINDPNIEDFSERLAA